MKKKTLMFLLAIMIFSVAGYNAYKSNQNVVISDLAIANIEALALDENVDRVDCTTASDLCSMVVIYPDGDYGEDILLGYTKKPGWI